MESGKRDVFAVSPTSFGKIQGLQHYMVPCGVQCNAPRQTECKACRPLRDPVDYSTNVCRDFVVRCTSRCRPNSPTLATDHPHAFKEDVVERAKHYAAGLTGGVGAYTNSQGIPAVREVHVDPFGTTIAPCGVTVAVLVVFRAFCY